jgi:DNA-directed RNA polymerase sigma subunit (sigma70/sigma32)
MIANSSCDAFVPRTKYHAPSGSSSSAVLLYDKKAPDDGDGDLSERLGGSSLSSRVPAVKNGALNPAKKGINNKLPTLKQTRSPRRKGFSSPTKSYELLAHGLLTKEEEQKLGFMIRRAAKIKEKMGLLMEQKELEDMELRQEQKRTYMANDDIDDDSLFSMEEQLEEYLMRNHRNSSNRRMGHYIRAYADFSGDNFYDSDDMDDEEWLGFSVYGIDQTRKGKTMKDFDSRSIATRGSDSLDIQQIKLSDEEIMNELGIAGGRYELRKLLLDGAMAKEKMIRSNIRLVTNIANKWLKKDNNSNRNAFDGSWTTPSKDELTQEGIIGLALAAERFEPERNLKFSTYATYYITNQIRICYQGASTGCLRLPPNYYAIRYRYQRLVNQYYEKTGKPLDLETVAKEMGLKTARLRFVLTVTEPLIQLDAPRPPSLRGVVGAGKAGGDFGRNDDVPIFGDSIER